MIYIKREKCKFRLSHLWMWKFFYIYRNLQTLILGGLQSEIIKGAVMKSLKGLSWYTSSFISSFIMLTCTTRPYFCYGTCEITYELLVRQICFPSITAEPRSLD